ncbi:MAG: cob(I)yrinic acid a,c-diamide adenosyltransferase [Candidatus Latescibacterota bacterium]|nr:MAG: cob(I)yrinic acid a,c-diamide adenosyltransferase [Candidatus Latescibacterota bacterium]
MTETERTGLIIVNTGNGKGKTTAALGTALRAVGTKFKVFMVQFIKGSWDYGELHVAERLAPYFEIKPMGEGFTWETKDKKRDTEVATKAWEFCKKLIDANEHDLLIFDELNNAMDYGYVDVDDVVNALKNKPKEVHIILTGRNAPQKIIDIAHLVTEMREIKHPFNQGIYAQRGIEF